MTDASIHRRQFLKIAAALLGSAAGDMSLVNAAFGGQPMRYSTWKTVCVGRYLVDVPTEAILTYLPLIDNEELSKMPGSREDAKKMALEKSRELMAAPHKTKESMYIKTYTMANGGWLVHGWKHRTSVEFMLAYLYIPVQTRGQSVIYLYKTTIFDYREQQTLQNLAYFGASFRPLAEGDIPKEPGFCLEDVMIANVPDSFDERLAIRMDDPRAKGLILSFGTEASGRSRNLWLTKEPGWSAEKCKRLGAGGKCDQLRFGRHDVGPIQGEELCVAAKTRDIGYRLYNFQWENPGVINSKTSPQLKATLLYQGIPWDHPTAPIPFSTDAEALAVWDKLVNSIRIRPVQ